MTVAQPEDHESSEFHHTFRSGKSLTLPRLKNLLSFGRARKMRKIAADEVMFLLLEEICDEAALAVLDDMSADETNEFFKAWQDDSGIIVGESSA